MHRLSEFHLSKAQCLRLEVQVPGVLSHIAALLADAQIEMPPTAITFVRNVKKDHNGGEQHDLL